MPSVITWNSIELLHNVVKTLNFLATLPEAEGRQALPTVTYRRKVKEHGTNCAVQIRTEGLVTQSREVVLTPDEDLKGFAKWVAANATYFRSLASGLTVFGEWCGPGVEPGMAVSQLPTKQFAVFGVLVGEGAGAVLVTDPEDICTYLASDVQKPQNMHVLPWEGGTIRINFADRSSLDAAVDQLNDIVKAVEAEDPWVKSTFNVSGMGEGIVLYPIAIEGREVPTDPEALAQFMFKAKGEKHRTTRQKEAVQVDASVVASVSAFVDLVVTEARLEQGVSVVGGREPKLTGNFVKWVADDVRKESVAELEASGLTWDKVATAVTTKARTWFLRK